MNFEEAKMAYIMECKNVGKMPRIVTTMTWDRISEQYTLSNKDGDFADIRPDGQVIRMHWK